MPEFRLNNKIYCGSSNQASAISYVNEDGSKTTVQDKIDKFIDFNKETVIGEWNGKKVYQSLLIGPLSMPSTSSFTGYQIDLTSLNIETILNYSFFIGTYSLPWIDESKGTIVTYIKYVTPSYITIANQLANWSDTYNYRLMLQYTKKA